MSGLRSEVPAPVLPVRHGSRRPPRPGSPGALLHRGPPRTAHATPRATRPRQPLEDPPAPPPYLLLRAPPVHLLPGVTIERGQALRSVHRGVQLARQFRPLRSLRLNGSPAHVSALSSPGSTTRHPGQLYGDLREEFPVLRAPLSCRLSAARHPLSGHPNGGYRVSPAQNTGPVRRMGS